MNIQHLLSITRAEGDDSDAGRSKKKDDPLPHFRCITSARESRREYLHGGYLDVRPFCQFDDHDWSVVLKHELVHKLVIDIDCAQCKANIQDHGTPESYIITFAKLLCQQVYRLVGRGITEQLSPSLPSSMMNDIYITQGRSHGFHVIFNRINVDIFAYKEILNQLSSCVNVFKDICIDSTCTSFPLPFGRFHTNVFKYDAISRSIHHVTKDLDPQYISPIANGNLNYFVSITFRAGTFYLISSDNNNAIETYLAREDVCKHNLAYYLKTNRDYINSLLFKMDRPLVEDMDVDADSDEIVSMATNDDRQLEEVVEEEEEEIKHDVDAGDSGIDNVGLSPTNSDVPINNDRKHTCFLEEHRHDAANEQQQQQQQQRHISPDLTYMDVYKPSHYFMPLVRIPIPDGHNLQPFDQTYWESICTSYHTDCLRISTVAAALAYLVKETSFKTMLPSVSSNHTHRPDATTALHISVEVMHVLLNLPATIVLVRDMYNQVAKLETRLRNLRCLDKDVIIRIVHSLVYYVSNENQYLLHLLRLPPNQLSTMIQEISVVCASGAVLMELAIAQWAEGNTYSGEVDHKCTALDFYETLYPDIIYEKQVNDSHDETRDFLEMLEFTPHVVTEESNATSTSKKRASKTKTLAKEFMRGIYMLWYKTIRRHETTCIFDGKKFVPYNIMEVLANRFQVKKALLEGSYMPESIPARKTICLHTTNIRHSELRLYMSRNTVTQWLEVTAGTQLCYLYRDYPGENDDVYIDSLVCNGAVDALKALQDLEQEIPKSALAVLLAQPVLPPHLSCRNIDDPTSLASLSLQDMTNLLKICKDSQMGTVRRLVCHMAHTCVCQHEIHPDDHHRPGWEVLGTLVDYYCVLFGALLHKCHYFYDPNINLSFSVIVRAFFGYSTWEQIGMTKPSTTMTSKDGSKKEKTSVQQAYSTRVRIPDDGGIIEPVSTYADADNDGYIGGGGSGAAGNSSLERTWNVRWPMFNSNVEYRRSVQERIRAALKLPELDSRRHNNISSDLDEKSYTISADRNQIWLWTAEDDTNTKLRYTSLRSRRKSTFSVDTILKTSFENVIQELKRMDVETYAQTVHHAKQNIDHYPDDVVCIILGLVLFTLKRNAIPVFLNEPVCRIFTDEARRIGDLFCHQYLSPLFGSVMYVSQSKPERGYLLTDILTREENVHKFPQFNLLWTRDKCKAVAIAETCMYFFTLGNFTKEMVKFYILLCLACEHAGQWMKKIFHIIGHTNGGKTKLIEMIRMYLSPSNAINLPSKLQSNAPWLSDFVENFVLTTEEVLEVGNLIKILVSESQSRYRMNKGNMFESVYPLSKLISTSNTPPDMANDNAIEQRFLVIPVEVQFMSAVNKLSEGFRWWTTQRDIELINNNLIRQFPHSEVYQTLGKNARVSLVQASSFYCLNVHYRILATSTPLEGIIVRGLLLMVMNVGLYVLGTGNSAMPVHALSENDFPESVRTSAKNWKQLNSPVHKFIDYLQITESEQTVASNTYPCKIIERAVSIYCRQMKVRNGQPKEIVDNLKSSFMSSYDNVNSCFTFQLNEDMLNKLLLNVV